jgi:dTDP-4-dehydrorhamnose 3,5-epimerase
MKIKIKGITLYKSKINKDSRGYFTEIYKKKLLKKNLIFHCLSSSKKFVLRGLHLQIKNSQAKFITVVSGKIFDVAVDLRRNSKTFGKFFKITLPYKSYNSIYIPEGFAHGFCGLSKNNIIYYCCTNYREKEHEVGILWNDKDLKIKWPIKNPILSKKDKNNITFKEYCDRYKI